MKLFSFCVGWFFLAFLNLELQSVSLFKVNEISEISEFSILGIGQNQKLGNLGNLHFFLFNDIGTFPFFFAQFIKKLLDTLKLSNITPVFEKLDPSNEANYRTVSILPLVSKKFEKMMYDKLYEYIETFLSQLLCGFCKAISPIPTFTKTVKRAWLGGFIGTILMNFSKACDCLRHNLLMVKFEAYGSPNLF